MKITLAIPTRDDTAGLIRLLARAAGRACVAAAVVVDDGSQVPLEPEALAAASGFDPARLTLLRNDAAQGPGPARNRALAHVQTDHLLFADADDLVTPELDCLCADLAGRTFDFCLFQHHDSRAGQEKRRGQMDWDHRFWEAAGVAAGALVSIDPQQAAQLVQTANYPWNKLYRTQFLRAHDIACSEIPLHEDVELHWRSFLRAETILTSDRLCAVHFVAHKGGRMTNRRGPERLQVFGPLTRIAEEIAATGADHLALPFARFALGLTVWIGQNIAPAHRPRLAELTRSFARGHIPDEIRARLAAQDPALAAEVFAES